MAPLSFPGFIDNHTHFLTGGFGLASVNLRDADSPEEFARRIGEFSRRGSLRGIGSDLAIGIMNVGAVSCRKQGWIDALTSDNPVFVMRLDGHMALANSKAIALAGVTAQTPDPDGGEIVRDENGELNWHIQRYSDGV